MLEYIIPIVLFFICWGVDVWLFWKWDLGEYRSEYENKNKEKR